MPGNQNPLLNGRMGVSGFALVSLVFSFASAVAVGSEIPLSQQTLPSHVEVAIVDQHGVETAHTEARPGAAYSVLATRQGPKIVPSGSRTSADQLIIKNEARLGSVRVRFYKAGRMIFESPVLSPDQRTIVPASSIN